MDEHPRLVPPDFEVPVVLETERFRLRMLAIHDLVKDYDAVMSSVEHIRSSFNLDPHESWPEGLTLEEDLIDLGWHQREFTLGVSFAYTVMSPDESICLGCVYLNPTRKRDYDVSVTLWVRASELASGLDQQLFECVKSWIESAWPFANPAFPGREIPAATWNSLPERS